MHSFLFALLFAFSCKKDNNSNSLTGKWHYVDSYYAISERYNGAVYYDSMQYVKFSGFGQVQSTYFTGASSYRFSGDNTITISFKGQAVSQATFYYTIRHDTLTLANKACIEGCNIIFARE